MIFNITSNRGAVWVQNVREGCEGWGSTAGPGPRGGTQGQVIRPVSRPRAARFISQQPEAFSLTKYVSGNETSFSSRLVMACESKETFL